MILSTLPQDASGRPSDDKQPGGTAPVPFYRRSLFWLLIGLLVGVALLLLLHSCQPKEEVPLQSVPAPEAKELSQEEKDAPFKDLLELQQAQNQGIEEEIRRLQQLLQEDPCALPTILGSSPEQTPVSPRYAQLEQSPATPRQADGTVTTPPSGKATAPPAANATLPAQTEDARPETSPPPQARQSGPDDADTAPKAAEATGPQDSGAQTRPSEGSAQAPKALPSPDTVGELMDKATVFILSHYEGQTGMGSGFFVAPGIIVTNSHVVQGPDAKVIVGNKALGGMQEARIIAFSSEQKRDYALLKINDDLASKAPVLMISPGAKRMEKVSAWGFPGFIAEIDPKLKALIQGDSRAAPEVVYSEGVVSVVLERTPPVILHTASISQGNSGGPLVNEQGVVVGINTFIKKANKSYSQTNIALTGEDLAKFITEQGIPASMVRQ